MLITNDPIMDFHNHDAEQETWLIRRPKCAFCGEHIQEDYAWRIEGDLVCDECLDKNFRERIPEC